MVILIDVLTDRLSGAYSGFLSNFTPSGALVINTFLFSIFLAIVSIFIWTFYNSNSRRNLIDINLRQYNRYQHPIAHKFGAIGLFFLEYIVIMPIIIGLWFIALSFVLLLLSSDRPINEILLISAGVVGAVRILAYHNEKLSEDLAKLFPFILLSVYLLSADAFSFSLVFEKIQGFPSLINHVFYYIVVVFFIEIVLRLFYTVYEFWDSEDEEVPNSA